MAKFTHDPHFLRFTKSLQDTIMGYELAEGDFTARQKAQVENLIKAEKQFKKVLQNDCRGVKAYHLFIKYILNDRKNILAARPFFRERQGIFSKGISPAIRKVKPKKLFKFRS